MTGTAQQKLDAYLARLRSLLRGFAEPEVRDIVDEIRAHVMDKAAAAGGLTPAAVETALASLGSPEELAGQYVTDDLLARAEVSRSPVRILEGLVRLATLSVAGAFACGASVIGYALGAIFFVVALLKPLHPHTAGLWLSRDAAGDLIYSIHLGFEAAPAVGREVLGWWIVPLGLCLGGGLLTTTTLFAIACVRQYRRAHVLPWAGPR